MHIVPPDNEFDPTFTVQLDLIDKSHLAGIVIHIPNNVYRGINLYRRQHIFPAT